MARTASSQASGLAFASPTGTSSGSVLAASSAAASFVSTSVGAGSPTTNALPRWRATRSASFSAVVPAIAVHGRKERTNHPSQERPSRPIESCPHLVRSFHARSTATPTQCMQNPVSVSGTKASGTAAPTGIPPTRRMSRTNTMGGVKATPAPSTEAIAKAKKRTPGTRRWMGDRNTRGPSAARRSIRCASPIRCGSRWPNLATFVASTGSSPQLERFGPCEAHAHEHEGEREGG